MTAPVRDLAQQAAVADYRRYASEITREAEAMRQQGKPLTARLWRSYALIARKAAIREAAPEGGE